MSVRFYRNTSAHRVGFWSDKPGWQRLIWAGPLFIIVDTRSRKELTRTGRARW
jgi:hypothetical protein